MSNPIHTFMVKMKEEQTELARAGMLYPKGMPFDHGVQVGIYQGLEKALEILGTVLRDDEDQRNKA